MSFMMANSLFYRVAKDGKGNKIGHYFVDFSFRIDVPIPAFKFFQFRPGQKVPKLFFQSQCQKLFFFTSIYETLLFSKIVFKFS